MRALVLIVTVLAALYGGYWVVGSRAVENGAVVALEDLETTGWLVEYADLSTAGFPSRFDTTVTDLTMASPDRSLTWETEFFQVLALSYRPNQLIAVWAPSQRFTWNGVPIELLSQLPIRASLDGGLSQPLRDARIESGEVVISVDEAVAVEAQRILAAMREATAGPSIYDVFIEADGLGPADGETFLDLVRVEAKATFDAPLDGSQESPPRLLSLSISDARVASGDNALTASGTLTPDVEGYLAGEVTIAAENWRGVLDLALERGLLADGFGTLLGRVLDGVAQGEDSLQVSIVLADGRISVLGLPLGAAPFVGQRQ